MVLVMSLAPMRRATDRLAWVLMAGLGAILPGCHSSVSIKNDGSEPLEYRLGSPHHGGWLVFGPSAYGWEWFQSGRVQPGEVVAVAAAPNDEISVSTIPPCPVEQ